MSLLGSIERFDLNNDSWTEYVEIVEQYFVANGIVDAEKKKGILLTVIGSETYRLLRNVIAPTKPKDKSFNQLVEALANHLNPKPLVIAERYKFYQRCQQTGESLKNYLAELRRLSEYCEFNDFLEDALRDKLVCGMQANNIRRRLLTEENLTLATATKVAFSMEVSARESELMNDTKPEIKFEVKPEPVNKVSNEKLRCFRCNNSNHLADKCRYKTFICNKCKVKGHLARACTSRVPEKSKWESSRRPEDSCKHCSDKCDTSGGAAGENVYTEEDELNFVYQIKGKEPYRINLKVNDTGIEFEIDTGSGKTIISEVVYMEKFKGVKLEPTKQVLRTYSGEPLNILGKIMVTMEHGGRTVDAEVYVVKGKGPVLLGRDMLSKMKLNWSTVYTVRNSPLDQLKEKHKELFSGKTGKMNGFQAKIYVKSDAIPKFCAPRKVPFAMQEAVSTELKRLENENIISSVAYSDWASPIVIVPKADGQIRICGDFKNTANKFIETEQYPLPNPDELFQKVQGGKKFSKLDLKTAYLQMELDKESRQYFIVNTGDGLKQFNRMPYGVTSGPAIFQRKLSSELKDIGMTVVNIDDILVSGKDDTEHLENLSKVFQKLSELGLTLKVSKCKFFQLSIEYVGFILNEHGISANPEKIKAVVEAPEPKNVSELQSFLGAVNYYAKFIEHMSTMASPLYQLLKKDTVWEWGEQEKKSFKKLKQCLTETPLLCLYDKSLPLKLACDASSYGVGAVLSHVFPDKTEKPIAYASRTLNKSEKNYSQLDKEALSIMFGIKKFHQYLFGRKFVLCTDNKALSYLIARNAPIPALAAARLVRWTLTLAAYDYDVEFKTTKQHCNADMLSRLPMNEGENWHSVNAINVMQLECMPITLEQMQQGTREDRVLKAVLNYLSTGKWPDEKALSNELKPYFHKRNELSLQDGVILWGLRVVIPYKYREFILAELHEGHPGIFRMKGLSRIHVWYPKIDGDIEDKVKSCYECSRNKNKPAKAFIHPWDWPTNAFDRVHVDFFSLHGKDYLLLADSYSKWVEIEVVKNTKTQTTTEALRKWFAQFGLPVQLVSDNGPQFIAAEFSHFLKMNGIKHIRSSAYHPCSNGGAERFVQTIKRGLKACYIEKGDMYKKLDNFLLAYRTTPSSVTGKTPCELFLGRQVRTRIDMIKPKGTVKSPSSPLATKMEKYNEKIRQRVEARQNVRKFSPGQNVFVANHVGKMKWLPGQIVRKVAERTYIVIVKGREVKRHIDDLIPNSRAIRIENEDDDVWMYGEYQLHGTTPPRPQTSSRGRKTYPRRVRRAVDRYGMVPQAHDE